MQVPIQNLHQYTVISVLVIQNGKNVKKTGNFKMLHDRNGHGKVKFNIYYLLDPTSSPNFVRIRDDHEIFALGSVCGAKDGCTAGII